MKFTLQMLNEGKPEQQLLRLGFTEALQIRAFKPLSSLHNGAVCKTFPAMQGQMQGGSESNLRLPIRIFLHHHRKKVKSGSGSEMLKDGCAVAAFFNLVSQTSIKLIFMGKDFDFSAVKIINPGFFRTSTEGNWLAFCGGREEKSFFCLL